VIGLQWTGKKPLVGGRVNHRREKGSGVSDQKIAATKKRFRKRRKKQNRRREGAMKGRLREAKPQKPFQPQEKKKWGAGKRCRMTGKTARQK